MSAPITATVTEVVQDNWQRTQRFRCKIVFGSGIYPVGGIPINSILGAALFPTSNKGPRRVTAISLVGSGLTYDYIRSSGSLMVLVVPASASLTSGNALTQLNSDQMHFVASDQIELTAEYDRNA